MFKHRLALALGRTVAEINCMGSSELTDWMAFYSIEPFGVYRENLHTGIIASLIYNSNRNKRQRPMSPDDFVIRDAYGKAKKDADSFLQALRSRAKPKAK